VRGAAAPGYTWPAMTITDRYGLPVTTASPVAAARFQEGMDKLLSYGAGAAECFAAAVQADEELAVAHAGAALVAVVQGDAATARAAVDRARAAVAGATRRERQHVEALGALVGGETTRGLDLVEEHVAEFPRDAMLVNQASSAIGFAGRRDREEQRMAFLERLAPAYGDDWWFQSALAFTYHEVDRYEESRRLSERSLQQYPGNANASHNLAHIYFEMLDTEAGAAFLAEWMIGYDRRASFHCHLAWHQAMFELHQGRYARALELFRRDIVGAVNPRLAMIDGSALLWRFRLDGWREQPLAWRPLADLLTECRDPVSCSARSTPRWPMRRVATKPRSRSWSTACGRSMRRAIRSRARWRCRWYRGPRHSWPGITPARSPIWSPSSASSTGSAAVTPSGSCSRRRWWRATSSSSATTTRFVSSAGACSAVPPRAISAGSTGRPPRSPRGRGEVGLRFVPAP